MDERKNKSDKKKKSDKEDEVKKQSPEHQSDEDENGYGGLPERDLRKNLGCGG